MFQNVDEIRAAVDAGHNVFWGNLAYSVLKGSLGEYVIVNGQTGHRIGLTWRDGKTLNGRPEEFFIA